MSAVFWDTNLFVYFYERHPVLGPVVSELWRKMQRNTDKLVTSYLTLGEIQVKASREGKKEAGQQLAVNIRRVAELVAFETSTVEAYVAVRTHTAVKGADAIQLASAMAAGARFFVTNDSALHGLRVPGSEMFCISLEQASQLLGS